MFLPVLVVVLALVAVTAVVGAMLRPTSTAGPVSPSEAWIAAVQHAGRVSATAWTGLVAAPLLVAVALVPALTGRATGLATGLLPVAGGAAFLTILAVGELTWPRPTGAVRRAPLAPRGARGLAPRGLVRLTAAWSLSLGALLVLSGLAADDDGRSLTWRLSEVATSGAGPFPGWYYGVPLGLAALVVLAGCSGVLRLIARRPAVSDTAACDDTALRQLSARRLLGGVQLVVAWTLAGCLFFAADCLRRTQGGEFDGVTLGSPVLVAIGILGMCAAPVVMVVSAVVASRSTRTPRRGDVDQRPDAYRQPAAQPQAS